MSHMFLDGTVVASWSLTQEVAGLKPFTVMTNIFVSEFAEFIENSIIHPKLLRLLPNGSSVPADGP